MRFYLKIIDKYDGNECYSVVESDCKDNAKAKYLRNYPTANILEVEEIPDGCLTVGELKKIFEKFPYCMPVYINSDGESMASEVNKTLAYGLFECIEIS